MSCHVVEKTRQNSFRNMLKNFPCGNHIELDRITISAKQTEWRRDIAVKRRFGIVRHSARRSFKDRSLPSMPNDSCPAITKSQTNPPPAQPRSRCKIGFLPNASSQARTKRGCLVCHYWSARELVVITLNRDRVIRLQPTPGLCAHSNRSSKIRISRSLSSELMNSLSGSFLSSQI